jgi:hypothetical protein
MQETRWDNTDVLTDAVKQEQVRVAAHALTAEPGPTPAKTNRAVVLHKPGDRVKLADGSEYRIGPKGNWICLDKIKKARRR